MSIHKTKCKTYEVKWRENGRLRSQTFKRKVDADKFHASLKLDRALAFFGEQPKEDPEVTFKELAETWLKDHAEVHNAPSTVIRDKQIIRDYLLPELGRQKLSEITKRKIVDLQSGLHHAGKLRAKTINNVIGVCHKIFADAVGWGVAKSNPVSHVKQIKCPEAEFRFWTFTDRDRFLTFIKSRNPTAFAIISFAIHTGLRRGEIEGLCRDCLDFDRREIIVKRNFCHKTNTLNEYTKGKKFRRVPMNEVVYEVLKKSMLLAPSERIFKLDFQHFVSRYFRPLQAEAGVNRITFHDLRHSFASHLAMSGVSVFDIQKLLGHSDIKTTMRYMHLAPDHLKGVTDVLMGKVSANNTISLRLEASN